MISEKMQTLGSSAKQAAAFLNQATSAQKNAALKQIAEAILAHGQQILAANQQDLEAIPQDEGAAFIDRLTLTREGIDAMANSVSEIAKLPDPVGRILTEWDRPNGLHIQRVSVPLGVIAVIYESRPNVTADASAIALKSGNAIILRGGSESFHSSQAIMQAITQGLEAAQFPLSCVQMLPSTDRALVQELLKMDDYVDVIIPRGGKSLIQTIAETSRIPLFKHLDGICHTYIHDPADLKMAKEVLLNAKLRRPGICGATETLLVDHSLAATFLPVICHALIEQGCEVRGDPPIQSLDSRIKPTKESDWDTEYLDAIISIKTVGGLEEAIEHINRHGSQHTDAIVTSDARAAKRFLEAVNSAIVMHNTSTQFADGGEFGMGAEIGISTGKLHARGPVGVEQLTTFKYLVTGKGQVRP